MATGSPISTLLLNLIPLVVRPSRTSRQGMIRLLSIGAVPSQEILEDLQSETTAFLRVKLGGHQVAPANGAGKLNAVVRHAHHHGRFGWGGIVTVNEVVFGTFGQALEYLVGFEKAYPVPAHVGDLQT